MVYRLRKAAPVLWLAVVCSCLGSAVAVEKTTARQSGQNTGAPMFDESSLFSLESANPSPGVSNRSSRRLIRTAQQMSDIPTRHLIDEPRMPNYRSTVTQDSDLTPTVPVDAECHGQAPASSEPHREVCAINAAVQDGADIAQCGCAGHAAGGECRSCESGNGTCGCGHGCGHGNCHGCGHGCGHGCCHGCGHGCCHGCGHCCRKGKRIVRALGRGIGCAVKKVARGACHLKHKIGSHMCCSSWDHCRVEDCLGECESGCLDDRCGDWEVLYDPGCGSCGSSCEPAPCHSSCGPVAHGCAVKHCIADKLSRKVHGFFSSIARGLHGHCGHSHCHGSAYSCGSPCDYGCGVIVDDRAVMSEFEYGDSMGYPPVEQLPLNYGDVGDGCAAKSAVRSRW